jgi:hypothetical protein
VLRAAIIFVTLFVLATFVVFLVLSAITMLAIMALVAIPLWRLARPHIQNAGIVGDGKPPLRRLQTMYAEGKIDMFEFERRVAKVLSREN